MGTRGPVPKRTDQRRRRNAPAVATTKVDGAAVGQPALDVEGLHPVAVDWFDSLGRSLESRFYTEAMWQRARAAAVMLSSVLSAGRPSSQMYVAVQNDMKALLVDAGELRRLGIEVQAAEPAAESNVIDWRARASAGA